MRKKNRAQLAHTATLILIVASAIVILIFITKFTSKATFDEAINTCRFSVMAQVASELRPGITGAKSPFDIDCERRYIRFYNTKVELGLNPNNMKLREVNFNGQDVKRFKTLTDSIVDEVIAEELRVCKYQFGDGKVDVFANDDPFWVSKSICFVCSEIEFEDTVKQEEFKTLVDYTKKTTFDDTGTSYYEYLTETSRTGNIVWAQPTYEASTILSLLRITVSQEYSNLELSKSKKYYIYFTKLKPAKADMARWTDGYWVAIIPAEDIKDYCAFQAS